jgi:hypothetical protein
MHLIAINLANYTDSMVAASHFGIDYDAVLNSTLIKTIGPVKTFAGPPPDQFQQQAPGFAGQFNGINSMVCKCFLLAVLSNPRC